MLLGVRNFQIFNSMEVSSEILLVLLITIDQKSELDLFIYLMYRNVYSIYPLT